MASPDYPHKNRERPSERMRAGGMRVRYNAV
jgi:hypothetical protein